MEIIVSVMAVLVAAGCLITLMAASARELQRSRHRDEQEK